MGDMACPRFLLFYGRHFDSDAICHLWGIYHEYTFNKCRNSSIRVLLLFLAHRKPSSISLTGNDVGFESHFLHKNKLLLLFIQPRFTMLPESHPHFPAPC